MIFRKNNFIFGMIIGIIAPILGLLLFKFYKFKVFTYRETYDFIRLEPGFKTLTVALSLSLLLNALIFTLYVNAQKDSTAKGIFATTMIYGLFILIIKTIY